MVRRVNEPLRPRAAHPLTAYLERRCLTDQRTIRGVMDEGVLGRLKQALSAEHRVALAATAAQANFTTRFAAALSSVVDGHLRLWSRMAVQTSRRLV